MSTPRTFLRLTSLGLAAALLVPGLTAVRLGAAPQSAGGGWDATGGDKDKKEHKEKDRHADERLDWWRQRIGGDLSPEFMAHLMRQAEMQRLQYSERFGDLVVPSNPLPEGLPLPMAVSGTTWTSIGPTSSQKIQNGTGNDRTDVNSGRMRVLLPDTGDANTLYALTAGGGLWKTTNFLSAPPTWTALMDAVGSTAGGSMAFGRVTTGAGTVLYAGIGDPFDLNVGGFVVKSSNAGASWSAPIQLGTATRILDVKVDTSQAQDIILVGTNAGLFRSTDGGATYAAVADADVSAREIWSIVRTSAGWLASAQDSVGTSRLVLTLDRGLTWAPVAVDLPNPAALKTPGRTTLAVGVPGDTTVYAFAASTDLDDPATAGTNESWPDRTQYDLFYSTNGGNNWTACSITAKVPTNSNADQGTMNLMDGQAFYNHLIVVDPDVVNRDTVYLGGNLSTARSINAKAAAGGSSWTLLTNWLPRGTFAVMPYAHADFHCATIATVGAVKRLYFGNDGGIALSSDGGVSWDHSKNKGITTHLVYALASGPICDPNTALIGLQDNGTHNRGSAVAPAKPTSGTVWDQTKGGDGFGVGWSQANNAATLASYVFNSIAQSTANPPDDQAKWGNFVTGLGTTGTADNGTSYYFVTPIVTAPYGADATGRVFYTYGNTGAGANSKKVFRSTAAGWTAMGTLPTPAALGSKLGVRAVSHGVGAHPTDANRVAAACNSGYVITTINAGGAWTAVDLIAGVPAVGARQWRGFNSSVAWVNNNILFACSESTTANSIHVAKSVNAGVSWTASETGLPDLPVTKIVLDPGDATGNTLYAATWLGVYRTLDQGATWSLFGAGLPQIRVTDLYVHPNSTFIRAATWGRGVWQLGTTPSYTPATTHPYGGTFTVGPPITPINMSVSAIPTFPAPTYQWKRNGVNLANGGAEGIAGVTSSALTIATPTCASAGVYTVTVTNCAGSVTSNGAVWTASIPSTVITEHPANTTYVTGSNFALKVVANGAGLTYQWRRGGTNLANGGKYSGVTTSTLSITNASNNTAEQGNYDCVVTLPGGCSAISNIAVVSKTNQAPNLIKNPTDLIRVVPASATFSVKVGGGGAGVAASLSFQWRKDGANLTNAAPNTWNTPVAVNVNSNTTQADATSTLTINPTVAGSGGLYDCVVTSNLTGSVTSAQARLTMQSYTPALTVGITPSPTLPVTAGTPVTFTAAGGGALVSGTATPAPGSAYQYQFWVYWNDYLGWTMVQNYGVGNSYVLPGSTAAGTYGLGVNVRTDPNVAYDTYGAINSFTINPSVGGIGGDGGGSYAAGSTNAPPAPAAPRISFGEFMQRRAAQAQAAHR